VNAQDNSLAALFERVGAAVDTGSYDAAAKLAASIRRFAPRNPTTALLCSRTLLHAGAAREALDSVRDSEDADGLVAQAVAALAAGLPLPAARLCNALLTRFAVDAIPGLAESAARLCRRYAQLYPGWIGCDTQLRLIGEIPQGACVTVEIDGCRIDTVHDTCSSPAVSFAAAVPGGQSGRLRARIGERELLGSGAHWPPDFGACGWVVLEGNSLLGEAQLQWAPGATVAITVEHDAGGFEFTADASVKDGAGRAFAHALDGLLFSQPALRVMLALPDGSHLPLAGSPILLRQPEPTPVGAVPVRLAHSEARVPRQAAAIDVVVPVYAGLEETLACLSSVLATVPPRLATITVVDDASPDPALSRALEELARDGRITLLRNPSNLGFPGAANRGMREHPERDVVLLNSDAEVFDGWLERLRAAAYASDDIATVTPLGEAASICSYPRAPRSSAYCAADALEIDRIARLGDAEASVDIPVGVGFCLYIRRDCLDEIGPFDERGFDRGYGEETDFCMRARLRGWRHVAATGVFIRHPGARSYGAARALLAARNSRVMNYRYPGYDALIERFVSADPLQKVRRHIDRERLLRGARAPVLLVTPNLPGGIRRHTDLRRERLRGQHTVIVLHATAEKPWRATLGVDGWDLADLQYEIPQEIPELIALFGQLHLVRVELHHFLELPDPLLEMLPRLGPPCDVFIHDYAWICPRVTLIGGSGSYCGEPAVEACEECVRQHGSELKEALTVAELRARSERILKGAASVVTPSADARARLKRYFPDLRVEVTPWEAAPAREHAARSVRARPNGRVRVALIGAIGASKGYEVLKSCAIDAAARDLPLEFVVIGYTRDDLPLLDTGRVFVTGPYQEREATALIDRESCDVLFFPTLGPETWCYSLTYALMRDLPIIAFDIGAVAERLRQAGRGVLLPLDTPPSMLNDLLIRNAHEQAAQTAAPQATPMPLHGEPPMQAPHHDTAAAPPELTATVQVITLPIGVYAFTVTGGGAPYTQGLAVPAFQVTQAPVNSEAKVEFLSGPATRDRWLTRSGDLVLTKISQTSAALLLTSLRTPDSGALAIDIRRLDADSTLPAAAAPPAENGALRPQVLVHVQNVGDQEFAGGWAGRIEDNYWIEGFAIRATETGADAMLEYKSVDYLARESEWTGGGALSGSRGAGTPLTAFAVRMNGTAAADYRCSYSGRFVSSAIVGPLADGALCRSEQSDDPLVGIELRIERRPIADAPPPG
jgi:GT2 family glycosyltransferase/glycosyltransferase involved in cell wall biosynthesis